MKGFAGITLGWVEEAENVSQVSWDILEPTIRAANSELWCSFNPNKESDPTWKNWIEPYRSQMEGGIYQDDEMLIIECNYSDNPWFSETPLPASMERMKSTDYDRYLWIWEGKFNKRSDEQVFGGKWRTAKFEPEINWHGPYYGMDFGFSQDPVAMVETWIEMLPDDRRKVYIRREYSRVGLEITDTPAAMLQSFPEAKKHRWHGDSSRPEMISHIRRQGFDIQPCNKWPGSVEEGVMWLRGCDEIVIHDDCVKVKEEMMNYSYKVDKLTGNVLTDIVDKWNHFMDAIRYSLNQHIVQRGAGWIRRKR